MPDLPKKLFANLRSTPLHPQWFAFFREAGNLRRTCASLEGVVLDVGCADGKARVLLSGAATYIGLDYFSTASDWYHTLPEVYGDAQRLPIADASIDHALLLDVLEHVPEPSAAVAELHRVLKPGGSLTLQVPFLYPIHDAPLDFQRWTREGLRFLAESHGFSIREEQPIGHPLETAALNMNIAMSKTVLNWVRRGNPLALLGALLPFTVLVSNVFAWLFAMLSRDDDFMPYAYRMVWAK